MSTVKHEIAVEPRGLNGSGNARRLRKSGRIPAVVYCKGKPSEMVSLAVGDWEALSRHDLNLVYLNGANGATACLVKEVQMNYLKNYVVHIDFQAVDLEEVIHAGVNLHTVGEAVGANRGGVLEVTLHQLQLSGKPAVLPESLEIDVTALNVGDAIHVRDIKLPAGVTALDDPGALVIRVAPGKVSDDASAEGEAEPALVKAKAEAAQ